MGESIGGLASLYFSLTHVVAADSEYPHHRDAQIENPDESVVKPFVEYINKTSISEIDSKE